MSPKRTPLFAAWPGDHADHNHAPGATLEFKDINAAHQVLTDPEYDAKWHPRSSIAVPHDHKYGTIRAIMAGIAAGTLSRC